MEWSVAKCNYFGRLGEKRCLFRLVFAVLGSRFNIYLCPNRIEKAQKRGLTSGDLGSFNKFNCAYDSLPLLIGIKLNND